jgi:NADH pyrophosphatase NudC (nudix superfamily)
MKFCPQCAAKLSIQNIDSMERTACSKQCGFVHWDNPIPVVAAIVRCNGRFILARNYKWEVGTFSLIAGFLEAYESPMPAILRETEEELGLQGHKATFIGHYTFPQRNQIIMAYLVEATGQLKLNHELVEAIELTTEELKAFDFGKLRLGPLVVEALFKHHL